MSTEPEHAPDGTPIYRYNEPVPESGLAHGDEALIEAISEHIERHIGPVHMVGHEILSEYVHIDVHHVLPTEERPFHVLVTSGMSERPMRTPPEIGPRRLELIVCLPPDWPMSDERGAWPQGWMRRLARFPHQFGTWLGAGHTIPNGDPAEPLGPGTRLSGWMLMVPLLLPDAVQALALPSGDRVGFLALIPLHAEEMDLKLRHGMESLLERLAAAGVTELIDPDRPSVVEPRRSWFRRWFGR